MRVLSLITAKLFPKPHILLQENVVVFAGADEEPCGNAYEFGIYAFPSNPEQGVWLPASATDPEIIAKLQAMEVGQLFKVTEEENTGPMETLVGGIEVMEGVPPLQFEKEEGFSGFISPKTLDFSS